MKFRVYSIILLYFCHSGMNDNANLGSGSEMKMSNTSDSNDSADVNMKRRNILFAEPNTGLYLKTLKITSHNFQN